MTDTFWSHAVQVNFFSRERETERDRERQKETERQTETERDRQRQRETDRETERQTERQRETERAKWTDIKYFISKFKRILQFDNQEIDMLYEEFVDYKT